jgi:hypothetical protein
MGGPFALTFSSILFGKFLERKAYQKLLRLPGKIPLDAAAAVH